MTKQDVMRAIKTCFICQKPWAAEDFEDDTRVVIVGPLNLAVHAECMEEDDE